MDIDEGAGRGGCGYKRAAQGVLVVTKLFNILTMLVVGYMNIHK